MLRVIVVVAYMQDWECPMGKRSPNRVYWGSGPFRGRDTASLSGSPGNRFFLKTGVFIVRARDDSSPSLLKTNRKKSERFLQVQDLFSDFFNHVFFVQSALISSQIQYQGLQHHFLVFVVRICHIPPMRDAGRFPSGRSRNREGSPAD